MTRRRAEHTAVSVSADAQRLTALRAAVDSARSMARLLHSTPTLLSDNGRNIADDFSELAKRCEREAWHIADHVYGLKRTESTRDQHEARHAISPAAHEVDENTEKARRELAEFRRLIGSAVESVELDTTAPA